MKIIVHARALDADVTIMVITVHVTTPFLRPFLFGTIFFAHTCLPPFYNKAHDRS